MEMLPHAGAASPLVPNSRSMLDARCSMLDARCSMHARQCSSASSPATSHAQRTRAISGRNATQFNHGLTAIAKYRMSCLVLDFASHARLGVEPSDRSPCSCSLRKLNQTSPRLRAPAVSGRHGAWAGHEHGGGLLDAGVVFYICTRPVCSPVPVVLEKSR
jgi:hypothetical protein